MYEPGKELVDVVDDEGRVVGVVTRREMRERGLLHRCTYVLVFDRAGRVFVHLRTADKDVYPSHWDVAVGGVVAAGETFEQGVKRELMEEIGIEADAEELFPFRYADENSSVQAIVYRVVHEGPFRLQPEEIVRGEFVRLVEIEELAQHRPFCPDSLAVLKLLRERWPRAFEPLAPGRRVLLGSGGFRTDERVRFLQGQMKEFFGNVRRLLFVPYALKDYDGYVKSMVDKGLNAGYELDGIHRHSDPQRAVRRAQGIYVGGGNTFRLLDTLQRFGLLEAIRERVDAGTPYLGISAGCNVACPTMKTTNDMPIVQPASLQALGLAPFQVNPHYFAGSSFLRAPHPTLPPEGGGQGGGQGESYQEHFGETRDDRIREFHEMNETPVIGLGEGGVLRIEKGDVTLLGASAKLFRRGRGAVELEPGKKFASALWM